jgi:hypothetical protein
MFRAVIERFGDVQYITQPCSACDIEADVILIWDIHSSHHVVIDGLKDHKSLKYTYFNDPYQIGMEGVYRDTGVYVCKLGAKTRTARALERGVDYIICPYTEQYYQHISPHLPEAEKMLCWFPPSPSIKRFGIDRPLTGRRHKILANGITWALDDSYDFRVWAYSQEESFYVQHAAYNTNVPCGQDYGNLLRMFTASLALCDHRIVPKYLEIPLAGCVCFAQYHEDYKRMGFKDGENCIIVDGDNFKDRTRAFLESNPEEYQSIADKGRSLIETKWTAEHFAEYLYRHAEERL